MALKRIAASTLSDISKHTPELAQTVVDNGAIAHLAQMILNPDAKLKVGQPKKKEAAFMELQDQDFIFCKMFASMIANNWDMNAKNYVI